MIGPTCVPSSLGLPTRTWLNCSFNSAKNASLILLGTKTRVPAVHT